MKLGVFGAVGSLGLGATAWEGYLTRLEDYKARGADYCGYLNLPFIQEDFVVLTGGKTDFWKASVSSRLNDIQSRGLLVTVRPSFPLIEQVTLISSVGTKLYTSDYIYRRTTQTALLSLAPYGYQHFFFVGHELHDMAPFGVVKEACKGIPNAQAYYGYRGLWNKFGLNVSLFPFVLHVALNSAGSNDPSAFSTSGVDCSPAKIFSAITDLRERVGTARIMAHVNVLPETPSTDVVKIAGLAKDSGMFEVFVFRAVDDKGRSIEPTNNIWEALKEV